MKKRLFFIALLALYIFALVKVMVLKDIPAITAGGVQIMFAGEYEIKPANFMPLTTIVPYLLGDRGLLIACVNLLGNVLPLVPLGILLPYIWRGVNWKKCLAAASVFNLGIEITQVLLHAGIFDIDDVILNVFGVMAGYVGAIKFTEWVHLQNYKNVAIVVTVFILATVAALYAFYPKQNSTTVPSSQNGNVCGVTQGTGEVVRQTGSELTIRRNDNTLQTIKIAKDATIKNNAGILSAHDIQPGHRVTVVVGSDEMASTILVCGN